MKYIIYTLSALLITVHFSCTRYKTCQQFDYEKFGLDTIAEKKPIWFYQNSDSIIFEVINSNIITTVKDSSSFIRAAECYNGFDASIDVPELNLSYNYSFSINDEGYLFSIFSPNFESKILKIDKLKELNFVIDKFEANNNLYPKLLSFTVKEGRLFQFKDTLGRIWQVK